MTDGRAWVARHGQGRATSLEDRSVSPAGRPELVDLLDRLDGVPDERAELALMLTLDERRTRRIVREELDRRGTGPD
jgi:hypothetical protein